MEKPILFNTEMVKAILDGRKTMTRRKIDTDISNQFDVDTDGTAIVYIDQSTGDSYEPTALCRYQPDDILWVRETWCQLFEMDGNEDFIEETGKYYYAADDGDFPFGDFYYDGKAQDHVRWRPSIHMPRPAARLFLRVKNIRAERLQDITEVDAIDEGALIISNTPEYKNAFDEAIRAGVRPPLGETPRQRFIRLWNSTIKKYDYGSFWQSNPWVWVIEFERVKGA